MCSGGVSISRPSEQILYIDKHIIYKKTEQLVSEKLSRLNFFREASTLGFTNPSGQEFDMISFLLMGSSQ